MGKVCSIVLSDCSRACHHHHICVDAPNQCRYWSIPRDISTTSTIPFPDWCPLLDEPSSTHPSFYVRSDHSCRRLPSNLNEAMDVLHDEIVNEGQTHGTLLNARPGSRSLHCHGRDTVDQFLCDAREWLKEEVK